VFVFVGTFRHCIKVEIIGMTVSQKDWIRENERLQLIKQFDETETGKFIDEFVSHYKKFLKGKVKYPKRKAMELAHEIVVIFYMKENLNLNCKLLTYSYNIAKHLSSNEYQKEINQQTQIEPPEFFDQIAAEDDIYEFLEKSDIKLAVNKCIKRLSKKCQSILRQYLEGIPANRATEVMGYTSKSIYLVRKSECMDKLQHEVLTYGDLAGLLN
jgi:DNA-directed RNA polymerase specialized sigma24 family protein